MTVTTNEYGQNNLCQLFQMVVESHNRKGLPQQFAEVYNGRWAMRVSSVA